MTRDPDQLRCRLETAEDALIRALKIAETVDAANQGHGIFMPGAGALADLQLRNALTAWKTAAEEYLGGKKGVDGT